MTTQTDRVLEFIAQYPGRDDDEIARLLHFSQRQAVNVICRKLAASGRIRRTTGPNGKIVNFPNDAPFHTVDADVVEPDADGEVASAKPFRPALKKDRLAKSGFVLSARWRLDPAGTLSADTRLPAAAGVYAFVKDEVAVYVGVATMGLRKRLYFYAKPGVTQHTSLRLNGLLKEELRNGAAIEIFTACPPNLEWNGLPVSGVAGLELGLIEAFHLPWNIRGVQ
ncbi:hypothetical protein [Bradyrhizobium sp. CCBAU 53380]|uniref:hypothetical protein n=1 Tax=Bradyrhizobium sp. CCBAU 53380 TaxID=1325117 RepID=UPI0023039BEC|nr:hypothetical protein [Bradyrhizobium sp. CCBAU 53380]